MTSPGTNQGDFAQPLAGLAQQQQVSVSTQVSTAALKNVDKAGTQQNADIRSALNFIDGTNGTVTVADNSGSDRVDVTVDVASSPTFSGTMTANEVVYNGMRAHRHPYANDRHVESGTATTSSGSVGVTFTSAFSAAPHVAVGIVGSGGSVSNFAAQQSAATTGVTLLAINPASGNLSGSFNIHWIAEGN